MRGGGQTKNPFKILDICERGRTLKKAALDNFKWVFLIFFPHHVFILKWFHDYWVDNSFILSTRHFFCYQIPFIFLIREVLEALLFSALQHLNCKGLYVRTCTRNK